MKKNFLKKDKLLSITPSERLRFSFTALVVGAILMFVLAIVGVAFIVKFIFGFHDDHTDDDDFNSSE